MAKRKRRNFTPEFKAKVVLEALSGESSQAELCRCHNLSEEQLSKWKQQFVENALKGRFIYVALLMDIFTQMIRGWQVSYHLNTSLTLKPLQEALFESGSPEIHHSDQGVQYLSTAYLSTLKEHGIEISLARRGHPWENGYAERLIRTLKEEEVHLNDYEDITEARQRIGQFITQVYHQKRPHSALGYLTPVEFQRKTFS